MFKSCLQKVKNCDGFASAINLNFSREDATFRSMPGAICTFIILLMTAVFALNSYRILAQREGTLFTATTLKNFNDKSNVFTEEDGFQVAFAVIDQNSADYTDVSGRKLSEYLEVTVSFDEYDESNSED